MRLPDKRKEIKNQRTYDLIVSTDGSDYSRKAKVGSRWVHTKGNPRQELKARPDYRPTHISQRSRDLKLGCKLFLRDAWPRFRRVDDYLTDIFFFEGNKPKNYDTKIAKDHSHK